MLPDVVDDFQLQHRRGPGVETIFYSSYVFFTKLSGAGALGISTLSLESVLGIGYTTSTEDQGGGKWRQNPHPSSHPCAVLYGVWRTPASELRGSELLISNLASSQLSGKGGVTHQ